MTLFLFFCLFVFVNVHHGSWCFGISFGEGFLIVYAISLIAIELFRFFFSSFVSFGNSPLCVNQHFLLVSFSFNLKDFL